MLARASFENFKALKRLDVDLSPFTLLVGQNSAGKTSVLQGVHLASQTGLKRPEEAKNPTARLGLLFSGPREPARLITKPGRGPMRITLASTDGQALSIEARLPEAEAEEGSTGFTISLTGDPPSSIRLPEDGVDAALTFLNSPVARSFASAVFLRLDATNMARPSITDSSEPRLEYDGSGLASVLDYFAGAERSILEEVTADLSQIVPLVRSVRTFPSPVQRRRQERIVIGDQAVNRSFDEEVWGHRLALEMGDDRVVPADLLSEGTVLALGLLVALRHPRCPRLMLIDDIDRGLHPSAQAKLVGCIRAILKARPNVQVVCTTHSPDLLDHVHLDEVRVMTLDPDGYAVCRRLSDHPESQRWRSMLRTGEFWASVGEDWLLEGASG